MTESQTPQTPEPLSRQELGVMAQDLRASLDRLLRKIRASAADEGLSLSQSSLLKRLARDGAATPAALARAELVRPQSMLATIKALDAEGFVARRSHPTDGRQVLIELTEDGRERLRKRQEVREDALTRMLEERLDPAEQHALAAATALLRRLAED
ncbi:MarR family transcriptional regulator [Streptomyces sp. NBC_01304]|uniref:MarR family transcriptional regulator n=1 Tax=Streptomyces sp. NBC_01304 TaxID=2903818 RepID=UPI002E1123D6|nr:MarR family transcriptional regulator [Streptomyces sp. NBC_01304]